MKKYLLLMLLVLIGMGASASTEIQLKLEETDSENPEWSSLVVTNAGEIKQGDFLIFSFDEASSSDQYAISNKSGDKIYTVGCKNNQNWYNCADGQKYFVLTVTKKFCDDIQRDGLLLQYKGLKNLKGYIKRIDYKPTGDNVTEIMSTPQYIKDWYSDGYVLKTDQDYVNKTLRVVCMETGDDAYAFLKKNKSGWPSLMSGSDKFSIAGWKYFEIKINGELNGLLRGEGLRIGGNNYYIAGIYVYDDGTTAPNWGEEESDIVDTYDFQNSVDGPVEGSSDWASRTIAGSFFEFKGRGQQRAIEPTKKIANTKNNIIRLYLKDTTSDTQISAKDAGDVNAAYIRERKHDITNNSFYYQNFADCGVADHYDFELSDAITVFDDWDKPKTGTDGVKTGMLSTLLLNGMNVGIKHGTITKLEIRKSMVSKYVTGYAIYTGHKLSSTYWRSVALPYNLSREQLEKAFGKDVVICELGESKVTKEETKTDNLTHYHYGISFNFTKIPDGEGINANYPYMIKLKNGVKPADFYPIENVKADVRDYQAYEFRTGKFDLSALDAKEPNAGDANKDKLQEIYDYEQEIKSKLTDKVHMIFKSTAPVFDITNTGVGNVEIINHTSNKTVLNIPSENADATNYYLYDNVLYPVKDHSVNLSSGLAYVVLPAETRSLFDNQPDDAAQAGAKITYFFCDENETTGIEEIDMTPASVCKAQQNVYSLDGQLVHKGLSVEGLAKGIYIVNGKKVIIK